MEILEERTLPSILFGDTPGLTTSDASGPVLANAQVRLVFWGFGWASHATLQAQMQNAVDTLNSSTYFYSPLPGADLSQYRPYSAARPTRVNSYNTTYNSPGSTFTTNDVSTMLQHEFGMTPNYYYYVVPDPDSYPTGSFDALHTFWSQSGNNEYFGYSRDLLTPSLDDLTYLYSHEMTESITDPDGTALQVNPRNGSNWNEICDGEAQNYSYRINGVLAQSYWSGANSKFTVATGQTQNFFVSSGHVLTVNGDQLVNHNDTITLDVSGGGVRVTLNGETAQFDPGRISSIVVNSGTGNDSIDVLRTVVPVSINSTGSATVNIGNAGSVAEISAPVSLNNPPVYDHLTIDDHADGAGRNVQVNSNSVTGFSGGSITWTSSSVDSVTILGGTGNNTYTVNAPQAYLGTTLNTGSGADTVNILATSAPLTVTTTTGPYGTNNTVNFGNSGSIAGIAAPVTVNNGPRYDHLVLDDHLDGTSTTVQVNSNSITGLSFGSVTWTSASVDTITILGGSGGNTYTISAPQAYLGTTLNTGTGADTVNVQAASAPLLVTTTSPTSNRDTVNIGNGGTLAGITGAVTINNNPSYDHLIIDDSLDGGNRAVAVNSNSLTGLSLGSINWTVSSVDSIVITGGSGNNTYGIGAPNAYLGTTLNTGGGTDSVAVGATTALLTVNGGGGWDTLVAPPPSNNWEVTGANAGLLSGLPYAVPAAFTGIQNLSAGVGGDHFLFDDGASVAGNVTGGGSDTLDYTPYTTSVVVDLQTGVATGVGGAVSGIQNVVGGSGVPLGPGVYNLLIGTGGNTLTGGVGRRNLLVAGGSASTLNAGDQEDLLIAGSTVYDSDPALVAWLQLAAYWAGSDPFATRVSNVLTGNGVPLLDPTVVSGNGGGNTLNGSGALALIYSDGLDAISGFDPGSPIVPIAP